MPSDTQIYICTVECSHITRNKKILYDSYTHERVICKLSLRDNWSLRLIIQTPYTASVGMSWDKFLSLWMMLHLNNNNAKAARGQPDYWSLFKIRPVIDMLNTKFEDVSTLEEWGSIPISRAYILPCSYQRKAPQIWNKNVQTLRGKKPLCPQHRSIYWGTSHQLRWCSVSSGYVTQ